MAAYGLRLGYGTWPLGGNAYGPVSEKETIHCLERAVEVGIRVFDTADIYGNGLVESLLGEVLYGIDDAVIISKVGYMNERSDLQDFSEVHILKSVAAILKRLRRLNIDVLLLHSPKHEVLMAGEAFEAMARIADRGLARKVGVSVRSFKDVDLVLKWPRCSVVELILNLLDQRPLDAGTLGKLKGRGIDVIARIPLCFGFLTGKYPVGTRFFPPDHRSRWPQSQIDKWIRGTESLRFLEKPDTRSLTQTALSFCLHHVEVNHVIPGMKSTLQIDHNAAATTDSCRLLPEEYGAIRHLWRKTLSIVPPVPHQSKNSVDYKKNEW